jgi:CDP-diacylglycerol--serine O-phosphatidyltransferase
MSPGADTPLPPGTELPPSTPRAMLKEARQERSISPVKEYFDAALRDEWDGLDRINRDLRLADLFTITNFLMGLGALLLATQGYVRLAVELVLIGVILDGVDGAVARLGKGGGPLGGVLDTLADALTFITTSAVVAFFSLHEGLGPEPTTLQYLAILLPLGLYAVCGVLRLARFESLRDDGKKRMYFSGIPSPAAAVTLLSLVLVDVPPVVLLASAVYVALLMVSRVRFPKLRGWYAVTSVAILVTVLVTFQQAQWQQVATWAMLAFMALYVVVGPFYVLAKYGAKFPHQEKAEEPARA